jgi:uncharacterized protein YlaI
MKTEQLVCPHCHESVGDAGVVKVETGLTQFQSFYYHPHAECFAFDDRTRGETAMDGPLVLLVTGHVCCACSAVEGTDKMVTYVRTGDAWFCDDCWHRLPADAVERVVREVALRGVPLS